MQSGVWGCTENLVIVLVAIGYCCVVCREGTNSSTNTRLLSRVPHKPERSLTLKERSHLVWFTSLFFKFHYRFVVKYQVFPEKSASSMQAAGNHKACTDYSDSEHQLRDYKEVFDAASFLQPTLPSKPTQLGQRIHLFFSRVSNQSLFLRC